MTTWTQEMTARYAAEFIKDLGRLLRVNARPPTTAEVLESLRERQRRRQATPTAGNRPKESP